MIDVETALLMVTRQGYTEEEVLPLLSIRRDSVPMEHCFLMKI